MLFENFKSFLASNLQQIQGWKTKRKIVVFESDDWGSVRMPSLEVYNILTNKKLKIGDHYNRNDSLATVYDLEILFNVLSSFKDRNGNHPLITANCLVVNPDFGKIRACNFETYYYEIFTDTLLRQKGCSNSFKLWQQGIRENIFRPQFHGREHLNIKMWMKALKNQHLETLIAFDNRFWGLETNFSFNNVKHFLSAFDFRDNNELSDLKDIIRDGLRIFKTCFGYESKSFIATNYTFHPEIEGTLFENGVRFIQGRRTQLIPNNNSKYYSKKRRYTGQYNNLGQIYIVRNAFFEPSENPNLNWINTCLDEISTAFFWRKPAIICCHRVNFIGAINPENRTRNILLFRQLINEILKRWPEVEFLSTDHLGELIANDN